MKILAAEANKVEEEVRVRAPKPASRTHDRVPLSLRNLDLFKATEIFRMYDIGTGSVNRDRFSRLLGHAIALQGYKEVISRADSDSYFDEIDIDMGETIEEDEFLSWLFRTDANYCICMRRRLHHMDEKEVLRHHAMMDTDRNGTLDKEEFSCFIKHFNEDLPRESVDNLFKYIDADGSGAISPMELLAWVHPTRHKATGIFESRLKNPVVIEFHVGLSYSQLTMPSIINFIATRFSQSKLRLQCRIMPGIKTCHKVVALVGRGVVLWDRPTMMMHHEDPFQGCKSHAMAWLQEVLATVVPHLMLVARR